MTSHLSHSSSLQPPLGLVHQSSLPQSLNLLHLSPPSASSQSSLSRYHPQHKRLQSPPVPRLRISMMGDELLLLARSNRTSMAGSAAPALNSARSIGSRDENDVPVYRHRLSQPPPPPPQVALSVGSTPQRTPRGAGVSHDEDDSLASIALGSCSHCHW